MGDLGSISGLGRSPRGGHGNSLQYSGLENPTEEPAGYSPWVPKSWAGLSDYELCTILYLPFHCINLCLVIKILIGLNNQNCHCIVALTSFSFLLWLFTENLETSLMYAQFRDNPRIWAGLECILGESFCYSSFLYGISLLNFLPLWWPSKSIIFWLSQTNVWGFLLQFYVRWATRMRVPSGDFIY